MKNENNCPRCLKKGIESMLESGLALQNALIQTLPDFANVAASNGATLTRAGEASLQNVLKCSQCGYSKCE